MAATETYSSVGGCSEKVQIPMDSLGVRSWDALTDHDYINRKKTRKTRPKIKGITAMYHCKRCGFKTLNRTVIEQHMDTHNTLTLNEQLAKTSKRPSRSTISTHSMKLQRQVRTPGKTPVALNKEPTDYVVCSCKIKAEKDYFVCPKCDYYTKNESGLKIHMKIHLKAKPYKCMDCPFHAKNIKDLVAHNKASH